MSSCELPSQSQAQAQGFRSRGQGPGRSPPPAVGAQGAAIGITAREPPSEARASASLSVHPNWPLGIAAASGASHLWLGNQRDSSAKQIQRSEVTNFLLALFFFFFLSFRKSFGDISQRAVSATSLLLHHSEHCNIIKLVKSKQWCLSFLQAARCSFRGEAASKALPVPQWGRAGFLFLFLSNEFCFQSKR